MGWVSANDLECDAPPCNRVEWSKDDEYENKPEKRKGQCFKLDEDILYELYVIRKLSPNQIERVSEHYFGKPCSNTKIIRNLKNYGIPIRSYKGRRWASN